MKKSQRSNKDVINFLSIMQFLSCLLTISGQPLLLHNTHIMELLGLSLSILIFWLIPALSAAAGNETDKLALLEFKAKIDEDPLGLLSSWNDSSHFCSWPGVTCSRSSQRVTGLDLPSSRLKGRLSPHVGNLSFLGTLNLGNNSFSLEIPPEIGRLFRLQTLDFNNNSFSGEIPANISGCSGLQSLRLVNNRLGGRIPKEIGSLPELRLLELSGNNLVGEIPDSVGNLSSLLHLLLIKNSLRGNIPNSLGQLRSLQRFVVSQNNLTGTVPLSLYNISTIENFAVSNNQLEGSLPPDLGHTIPNLQYFYFDSNRFSGSIPATISNASNLVLFQVQFNNFTGKIPSFASSSNLQILALSDNNLGHAGDGDLDFLHDLFNRTNLQGLGVSNNNLGGAIPETISNITSLRILALGRNRISGNIPIEIGKIGNLEALGMEGNQLTGPIPDTIGRLRKMRMLSFENNKLSGAIPSTLRNLTSLIGLSLATNDLQGNIPQSLVECRNLQQLFLQENSLSGTIPLELFSLTSLSIALNLSGNRLTGSIPIEVEKLVNLGSLDISENKISGEIPKALGRCISLEYLYLQGNFLEGSIPEELDSLRGVQEIDLSRNNLSGTIPEYFADLRALVYLNLSFNEFEGQVPQLGVFKNMSQFSIVGNTRLCGGLPELKLGICKSDVHKNKKLSHRTKLILIGACATVALVVILFLITIAFRLRKRSKPIDPEPSVQISLPRVSYGDLSKATNGFSQENLIGSGGFGAVYRGILNQDDRLVAVKVLNLRVSRASKSFIAECESLGSIRHRNLVKLLTICSSSDFQGNDFKALVYEFMENGNLDEWLHSSQIRENPGLGQRPRLNLIQRVSIATDVASALDYLHNHCSESIAHCDIKPSNILLDSQMIARVGDFGLAKLLKIDFAPSNQTSSVGIRGTIGYVAPEYAMGNKVSTLGDIYSFGILLLEMFTGKRPTDSMFKDERDLRNFASTALPDGISEIVDPTLLEGEERDSEDGIYGGDDQDQTTRESLISIVEIGVACSSKVPGERRKIDDVATELRQIRDTLCRMQRNHISKAKESEAPLLSGN